MILCLFLPVSIVQSNAKVYLNSKSSLYRRNRFSIPNQRIDPTELRPTTDWSIFTFKPDERCSLIDYSLLPPFSYLGVIKFVNQIKNTRSSIILPNVKSFYRYLFRPLILISRCLLWFHAWWTASVSNKWRKLQFHFYPFNHSTDQFHDNTRKTLFWWNNDQSTQEQRRRLGNASCSVRPINHYTWLDRSTSDCQNPVYLS